MTLFYFLPLVYFYVGLFLVETRGHFNAVHLVVFSLLLALWTKLPRQTGKILSLRHTLLFLIFLTFCFLLRVGAFRSVLIEISRREAWIALKAVTNVAAAMALIAGYFVWKNKSTAERWVLGSAGVILVCLLLTRILTLIAVPAPYIDVFHTNTMGSDFLIQGKNPYLSQYPDIYNGIFDYPPGYVYWPTVLYANTLARFFFGDIRVALIGADIVTSCFIWLILAHYKIPKTIAIWSLVFIQSLCVSNFVLQEAWVDPLLVAGFFIALYALVKRKGLLLGGALALCLGSKQYAIFLPLFIGFHLLLTGQYRFLFKALLTFVLVLGALFTPFLWLSFEGFTRMTVLVPLRQAMRPDSFSVVAFFHHIFHVAFPAWAYSVGALVGTIGAALLLWRDRTLAGVTRALFFQYALVFLFGKQAFCNYYYFLALILIAEWLLRLSEITFTRSDLATEKR